VTKKQREKEQRLSNRLIARLISILGASARNVSFEKIRLVREGKVMLVVARHVYCRECKKRHRTLIHLASWQKNMRKLIAKKK
jgi:hypothetical protein